MGLLLKEVKEDHEFGPLIVAFRKGFIDPGHPLWPLYTADLKPYTNERVQAVLNESTQRFIEWHHHDPTSTWLQVVDEDTGEVVAGARWSIFKKDGGNPYDEHEHVEATWFPEGDLRTVADKLINDFLASAVKHANHPHASVLNIIFTGIAQAKQNGLGLFLEATREGKPVYERYGFHVIEEHSLSLGDLEELVENNPELKRAVYGNLLPLTWSSMVKHAE
ncbi:hypothetical protein AMS68_001115 [Peltaster fructicola]|uniref:N-acetyltransferase domain-containing protein n=1 Tax=Peltaster fructicola TaxID=286661 RepID=A0A6H0XLV0_9PEZI|nr:hypothetical protein AMS68_001115 [Peltaster fructicola]